MAKQKVYFISGDLGIKIGVSKDPWARMRSLGLPSLKLLATELGGKPRERALHQRFAHLRRGRSEWFHPSRELWRYIQSVRGRRA